MNLKALALGGLFTALILRGISGCQPAKDAASAATVGAELEACTESSATGCEYVACCVKVANANGLDPAKACALELCKATP